MKKIDFQIPEGDDMTELLRRFQGTNTTPPDF
jgi:hypothetical protein